MRSSGPFTTDNNQYISSILVDKFQLKDHDDETTMMIFLYVRFETVINVNMIVIFILLTVIDENNQLTFVLISNNNIKMLIVVEVAES